MKVSKIITYCTQRGKLPFLKWCEGLDPKAQSIILARLERVANNDLGDCKRLKDGHGLWELRIDYSPGYRIYFGESDDSIVILLLGGDKGHQEHDIEKAKDCWLDFLKVSPGNNFN